MWLSLPREQNRPNSTLESVLRVDVETGTDWGADVVKIEPPTGDPARTFHRMLGGDLPRNPPFARGSDYEALIAAGAIRRVD